MEVEKLTADGEIVLHIARKHFLVYLEDVIIHGFGCLLLITGVYFLSDRGGIVEGYVSLLLCMFMLLFFTSFFYAWTKDYFDTWYVTDVHIVAVNQKSILDREISYMEYSRIQDVFFEKEGILQTFFGYGRIKIQTAGSDQPFAIEAVRDVENLTRAIIELRDKKPATSV
ncbi:MAG: PH domain-containing protein [Candidatus Pacebacteria bacterium]|nr:PH domain-containing protein [Candidatus Paceibacterota bacterium]